MGGALKILIYTQFCSPEPIFKSTPFAAELMRRGHEVRILTGFPNYPGGKLYSGYKLGLAMRQELEGVRVLRTILVPSHGGSRLGRMLNYCSFGISSAMPLFAGWRADIVYVLSLVTLGSLAYLNKRLRGVPFVMDVQDLWPDSVFESELGSRWMRWPLEAISSMAYRRADRVVALSPGMMDVLGARGVEGRRLRHIYNWCDEKGLRAGGSEPEPGPPEFEGRFNVLYAGNLGLVQGLASVIEAARLVAAAEPRAQFVFMGGGVCEGELRRLAREKAPRNVVFLGRRPMGEAAVAMRRADVLLIHLLNRPILEVTIPSKTQAYLAMGRPILGAVGRDARNLIETAGAGLTCKPGDAASIADAAIRLCRMDRGVLEAMGRAGRSFYDRELSLRVGVDRWERVFQEVLAERGGGGHGSQH